MPSSGRRSAPGNLLIESPSDDSDIPDLELIAPVKQQRRKKLFSKKFSPRISIRNGEIEAEALCSSSCALGCLLFSLVLGLVVLSCFTLSLSSELNSLKALVAERCSNSSDSLQNTIHELRNEVKQCCKSSSGASNSPVDSKKDETKNDASTGRVVIDHSTNTQSDNNSSNQLAITNDLAQLTNYTFTFVSNFKRNIEKITIRLDALEAKCSSGGCPPASSTTPESHIDGANGQKGSAPVTTGQSSSSTQVDSASKHRRSDVVASKESFQFVRKP